MVTQIATLDGKLNDIVGREPTSDPPPFLGQDVSTLYGGHRAPAYRTAGTLPHNMLRRPLGFAANATCQDTLRSSLSMGLRVHYGLLPPRSFSVVFVPSSTL